MTGGNTGIYFGRQLTIEHRVVMQILQLGCVSCDHSHWAEVSYF